MPGLDQTITSRPVAYGGLEQGRGRLRSITIDTTVHGRGISSRSGRFTLTAPSTGKHGLTWTLTHTNEAATHRPLTAVR